MNLSRFARMILQEISFFWIWNDLDFRSDPNLRLRTENFVSTRTRLRYRTKSKLSIISFRYLPQMLAVLLQNLAGITESAWRVSRISRCIFSESYPRSMT